MTHDNLTYEDVRAWILANSHDTDTMDDINRLTYVFTSKFQAKRTQ